MRGQCFCPSQRNSNGTASPNASEVQTGHFFGVKRTAMMTPSKSVTISATANMTINARNSVGEPVSATPAVADNCLYVRGGEHLFCIGKPKK